jgi:Contractile injection system tube protein
MDAQSAIKLPFNLKILPVSEETGLPSGVPFLAMFNPDTIAISETVEWQERAAAGSEGAAQTYVRTPGRTFTIDIMLDGTGVNTNGVKIPVTAQVLLFRLATTKVNGGEHTPNKLLLQYGLLILNCKLQSSTVTYTMFDMFGLPIRAKISASFKEVVAPGLMAALSMLSSPDLTHSVTVNQWDILPLLTRNIYKKQDYYLQVAKVNRLKNFRKLEAGSTLVFPPIAKK